MPNDVGINMLIYQEMNPFVWGKHNMFVEKIIHMGSDIDL